MSLHITEPVFLVCTNIIMVNTVLDVVFILQPFFGQLGHTGYRNLYLGALWPMGFSGKRDGFFKTQIITRIITNQTIQGHRNFTSTEK